MYRDLEEPLIPVLADIERAGIKVDTAALAVLGRKMQRELDDLCIRIYGHAGVRVQHQLAETARRCFVQRR